MKCMSEVWMIKKIGTNKIPYQCTEEPIKKCKHDFYTCDKHYHGCE